MIALTLVSHAPCPHAQRAAIVLKEKGVDFERIDVDLANKPDWFLRLSPLGRTPVLSVGGEALFESAVICEYLDETRPPRLHPADALARARERAWMEFGSAVLGGIAGLYGASDAPALEKAHAALRARFEQLEAVLGEGPWFAGRRFGLVDAAFGPVSQRLREFLLERGSELSRRLHMDMHVRGQAAKVPSLTAAAR